MSIRMHPALLRAATRSAARVPTPPSASTARLIPTATTFHRRQLHASPAVLRAAGNPGAMPDGLADKPVKGRTGGGEPLDSSSKNAAPKPKISNQSVPGANAGDSLTKEQREEVERHNREFAEKHDRGNSAAGDKVDKKFWGSDRGTE